MRIRNFGGLARWMAALAMCVAPAMVIPAKADQIVLNNGDRITGTIDSAEAGKLTIVSPIAGKIVVDMANVKTFSTDGPIKIVLDDGTTINQRVTEGSDGSIETAAGGMLAVQAVPLARIDAINPPPIAWTGSITFNGSLAQGDTYAEQIGLNVDLLRRSKSDRIEVQGEYLFGRQKVNGITTTSTDQWDIEASYNYFMTKKLFVLGDIRVEKNRIQHLDIRVTPNAGFGYQFVERPDFNANVQGGLAWVYEDYTNIGTPDENLSLRLAYHIDKTLWKERLKAFSDCAYFPGLQNASKYLVLFDAGLRLALTKTMFSELKGVVDYDSHPCADEPSHRHAAHPRRRLDILIGLLLMPRIQKVLAGVGVASRRNVEQMIRDGRVALQRPDRHRAADPGRSRTGQDSGGRRTGEPFVGARRSPAVYPFEQAEECLRHQRRPGRTDPRDRSASAEPPRPGLSRRAP